MEYFSSWVLTSFLKFNFMKGGTNMKFKSFLIKFLDKIAVIILLVIILILVLKIKTQSNLIG